VRPLSSTVDAAALQGELAAGNAVFVCERPAMDEGRGDCGGELVVEGFAAAPGGVASVDVAIADRGVFAAEVGISRPDARLVLGDRPGARRPGFRAEIDTSSWPPGVLDLSVTVRGRDGEEAVGWGRPRWFPSVERFIEPAHAGRCALLWVDPVLAAPVGEMVLVSGCAASPHGIERVDIEAPGAGDGTALLLGLAAVHTEPLRMPPGWVRGYSLRLDLQGVSPGRYPIRITATDRVGDSAHQEGTLVVDPAERYARWRAAHPERAQATAGLEPPALVVIGGDARRAERIADEQALRPASVEHLGAPVDLGEILRRTAASGTALVLVDDGAAPVPDALACLAAAVRPNGEADVAYGDEEQELDDGRVVPRFKPGWSPELLLGADYTGGIVAIGAAGARAALEGWPSTPTSVRELLLRLVDEPLAVERLPHVLARRMGGNHTPSAAAEAAIREIARRRNRKCSLEPIHGDSLARVRWPLSERPRVSVVIPTLGKESPLRTCLAALQAGTVYDPWNVVLVDSGAGMAEAVAADVLGDMPWTCLRYDRDEFNFSRAVNLGAAAATGDLVLYLNDDTEFPDPGWLEALVEYATLPSMGAVGPLLLNPGGTVQCAGVFVNDTGQAPDKTPSHAWRSLPGNSIGPNGVGAVATDVAVVGGACALVPRAVVEAVGGWDERFRIDYGDLDFCLRIRELGRRVVCVPWSRVVHAESSTRPNLPDHRDRTAFHDRWGLALAAGDPWHHPAYDYRHEGELRLAGVDP